jgi:3-oxoacyl-[acyl-carrier protein] reductase
MFKLDGRACIVTGAGSARGIGRAVALAMVAQGAALTLCDVDAESVKQLADHITDIGGRVIHLKADVTSEEDVAKVVQTTIDQWGKVDILVNNAGITQPVKVLDTSVADWDRVVNVNLKGTFICSKAVLPNMINNGYGRIVNLSSVSAKRGGGVFGGAHYSAAKAGVLGFAKALAREVSPYGITVNSVTPGLIATDIRGGLETPEEQKRMSADIPCRRMGTPEEVAASICFLASEEAAYITGEEIDINGGSHMD